MTIFTYHEKIETWDHLRLVTIWKQRWQQAGFKPIVLGRDIAKRHPRYGEFLAKVRSFPSINDRRYEDACYLRWLAVSVIMGIMRTSALMSDYDVLPLGFQDEHVVPGPIVCHERTRVPCLVGLAGKGPERVIDFILSRTVPNDCQHYSDMYAFKESDWPIHETCVELGTPGWQQAPAVHCASGAIAREAPGMDKTDYIVRHFE